MQRIDAHQHFWKFDPVRDSWIDDKMKLIQRDFLPADLLPHLQENGLDGCVVVQSDQSEAENAFQLANVEAHEFIKGIVGWVDLRSAGIEARLEYYSRHPKIKGFRHVLQGEPDRGLMLTPPFKRGISLLAGFNFSYDILIFPDQLRFARELVAEFPQQRFVLDHIAKPPIKGGGINEWREDIEKLAPFENLHCKISGMVTEADWKNWKPGDFKPYLDIIVETFGTGRIMYGSDWPVCLVAGSYKQVKAIVDDYFSPFSTEEKDSFFGGNATKFYNL